MSYFLCRLNHLFLHCSARCARNFFPKHFHYYLFRHVKPCLPLQLFSVPPRGAYHQILSGICHFRCYDRYHNHHRLHHTGCDADRRSHLHRLRHHNPRPHSHHPHRSCCCGDGCHNHHLHHTCCYGDGYHSHHLLHTCPCADHRSHHLPLHLCVYC